MAQITDERLTVEDILACTPAAVLADLGFPGYNDRTARAILNAVEHYSPWGVCVHDILNESRLFRHARDNDW